jgi:transcriptional regulator of acetoin/glycerol metabolism
MMSPTGIAPEDELPPALEGPDLVTAVREYGCAREHLLITNQTTFTVGSSPTCNLVVAREYVSGVHCLLERRGHRLRVHDQTSRNGTFFQGRREMIFDVASGDTFVLATTKLLAVNEAMRVTRVILPALLGQDSHAVLDEVLIASVQDGPILVVGPEGAGQMELVRAIHEMSVRRDQALVEAPVPPTEREAMRQLITKAHRGTLAVTVTGEPLDDLFLDLVLAAEFHVRLIVLAHSLKAVMKSVRLDALARMNHVELRPLREHPDNLGTLLDRLFSEKELSLRMSDLTTENQDALRAHDWPGNLDELREVASYIGAIVSAGSIRGAARLIDVPRTTIQKRMDRLDLTLPLTREDRSSGISWSSGLPDHRPRPDDRGPAEGRSRSPR